ncbi:MAG TPA: hypothetical protein VGM30_21065 [Puia sp.]|jgi:hypothetical protein
MENKESLAEALSDLKKKGYEADLNFETETVSLYGRELDLRLDTEQFQVDGTECIGDDTKPDEVLVVIAISSSTGVKGVIVDEERKPGIL